MPRQEEAGAMEEATVSWQEKILSQREVQQYGDIINCNTVRERHYHEYVPYIVIGISINCNLILI